MEEWNYKAYLPKEKYKTSYYKITMPKKMLDGT